MTTPEKLAQKINEINISKRNICEKQLEEMLFIFEHQGFVERTQNICFMSVIGIYSGSKLEEYKNR